MKKLHYFLFIGILTLIASCENGTTYEEIKSIKPISERVYDLHKTMNDIQTFEESAALVRQEKYYLEYEYPIGEDESYVVGYRFNDSGCFEIKLTAYLNSENEAQKVVNKVSANLKANANIASTRVITDHYQWKTSGTDASLDLNMEGIERGIISLTILAER